MSRSPCHLPRGRQHHCHYSSTKDSRLTRLATLPKVTDGRRQVHRAQMGVEQKKGPKCPGVQAVLAMSHTEQAPSGQAALLTPTSPSPIHSFIDSAVTLTGCLPGETLGKGRSSWVGLSPSHGGACHSGTRWEGDSLPYPSPRGRPISLRLPSHLPHPGAEGPLPGAGLLQAEVGVEEDQVDVALQVLQAPELQPPSRLGLFGGLCLEDKRRASARRPTV